MALKSIRNRVTVKTRTKTQGNPFRPPLLRSPFGRRRRCVYKYACRADNGSSSRSVRPSRRCAAQAIASAREHIAHHNYYVSWSLIACGMDTAQRSAARRGYTSRFSVAVALLLLVLLASDGGASTSRTLIGKNAIQVTESSVRCKNGKSTTVTTEVSGDLYADSDKRTDFKGTKWTNRMVEMDRERDDERGHVVASVFGGPIEEWNMVPMHRSVNRRITAQSSLLNRWDEFEKWAREQVKKKNVPVRFTIRIRYGPQNGCRPIGFGISATAKGTSGFQASFDNGPYGSFAVSSQPSRPKKKKP